MNKLYIRYLFQVKLTKMFHFNSLAVFTLQMTNIKCQPFHNIHLLLMRHTLDNEDKNNFNSFTEIDTNLRERSNKDPKSLSKMITSFYFLKTA